MRDAVKRGTVLRVDAHACLVDVEGEEWLCRVRGRLHSKTRDERGPVAAGDRVGVRATAPGEGVVEEREPRTSKLSRAGIDTRSNEEQVVAANVDAILVVLALREPPLRLGFIDRLLVVAAWEGLTAALVLNKVDLAEPGEIDAVAGPYREIGYRVFTTHAVAGEGVAMIREALAGRSTVVVGQSGVGKSTLLNAIQPGLGIATASVSASTSKGRHTTTAAQLHRLADGGFVVDTPGVREFGLWGIERSELASLFPEMRDLVGRCRFNGCEHTHEPGCAIKAAVGAGIDERRYESYTRILETI